MSQRWTRVSVYMIVTAAHAAAAIGGLPAVGRADQSFRAPASWSGSFPPEGPLDDDPPFELADIDGDGRKDVVHFGKAGVTVAFSNGSSFRPTFVLAAYGADQGWNQHDHARTLGDVNHDGRDDIVGFGPAGVYVSLSTGSGFASPVRAVANFGYYQGWRVPYHDRMLADVDNDGRQDIVGFGDDGVWLSRSTASTAPTFTLPSFVLAEFGRQQGWNPGHVRTTADVNGDGMADIVAMGDGGVWIALSTGTGFAAARFVLADFGTSTGWGPNHARVLVDVDNDGKDDIVGFGDTATVWARSTGSGFTGPVQASPHFGNNWMVTTKARTAVDLDGDRYPDLLFVAKDAIYRILGSPTGFGDPRMVLRDLVSDTGVDAFLMVRQLVGDVDGDGLPDLVGLAHWKVWGEELRVALSTDLPPPPPPAVPSGVRMVARTNNAIKIAWNDNSTDELEFIVHFAKYGHAKLPYPGHPNVANRVVTKLEADSDYCFSVQAASVFSFSARSPSYCIRTAAAGTTYPPLDPGLAFVCGAPGPCPSGFHAVEFDRFAVCPGDGVADNHTTCAADVDTFTACGSCPPAFPAVGSGHFEAACALPPSSSFSNARRCSQGVTGP